MIAVIHNFDGNPPPQGASEPMRLALLRRFNASPDGSEYWLARPEASFSYKANDSDIDVTHVVVGPGSMGQNFALGFEGRINLAYVTDPSLLDDDAIDFRKADYVAYGTGSVTE